MMKKIALPVIILILLTLPFMTAGCGGASKTGESPVSPESPPAATSPADKPPAAAPPADKIETDQSDSSTVARAFIEALQTADLNTLNQICRFTEQSLTPEKVLQEFGEYVSQIPADEVVIAEADLGPDITGFFFVGLKDDPGLILLALKTAQIDRKFYVVIITDDPEYEF